MVGCNSVAMSSKIKVVTDAILDIAQKRNDHGPVPNSSTKKGNRPSNWAIIIDDEVAFHVNKSGHNGDNWGLA